MMIIRIAFFRICTNKYDDISVGLILSCHLLSLQEVATVLTINLIKSEDFQPLANNILQAFLLCTVCSIPGQT